MAMDARKALHVFLTQALLLQKVVLVVKQRIMATQDPFLHQILLSTPLRTKTQKRFTSVHLSGTRENKSYHKVASCQFTLDLEEKSTRM